MIITFHDTSFVLQRILLVFSQLTVVSLAGSFIFMFKRRSSASKQMITGMVFLVNVIMYVLMQLDSGIIGIGAEMTLSLPYAAAVIITLISLVFNIRVILSETKNRKSISHSSIKESFDNLPTGVCFFNEDGLPVLCNLAMQSFSFAVCGKDVQYINDLENCFMEDFVPLTGITKEGNIFILGDGTAWYLEKRIFDHEDGNTFTQYIATDVTELHKSRMELIRENELLRRVQKELKKLSANVLTVTREEEILNTKMRVHDEMGKCLMTAQRWLNENNNENIPEDMIAYWQRAVSMLKYNNDIQEEDMLYQIRKTCESVNLNFVQHGKLPTEENVAYLLTCAVRECLTNAVRYADAKRLYVHFMETGNEATVIVSNDGKQPEKEIEEGGGLSTLRRRVERTGGTMSIQSFPEFKLTVTIPKRKRGLL